MPSTASEADVAAKRQRVGLEAGDAADGVEGETDRGLPMSSVSIQEGANVATGEYTLFGFASGTGPWPCFS